MATQIFETKELFNAREDKSINGVSPRFAEIESDYIQDNLTNVGCWCCYKCTECTQCEWLEKAQDCVYGTNLFSSN